MPRGKANVPKKDDELNKNLAAVEPVDPTNDVPELNEDELKAESERVAKLMQEKKDKIAERTYTAEDLAKIVDAELKKRGLVAKDEADEDKPALPLCRLSRFMGKFIIDIKDQNTDPYVKSKVEAFDMFNEQTRQMEPWMTLIFDDETEMTVKAWQAIKGSKPVQATILETMKEDTSYNVLGPDGKPKKIEVTDVKWDSYKSSGSGKMVTQRIKSFHAKYKVQVPDGRVFTVGGNVINWA